MAPPIISLNSEIDALNEAENITKTTFQQHCSEMIKDIIAYSPDSFGDILKLKTYMIELAEAQKEINALISGITEINSIDKVNLTAEEAHIKFEKAVKEYTEENDIDDDERGIISYLDSFINEEQVEPDTEIGDEDGELLVTKAIESYIDPLTQCAMKDPVKSKICNHAYEKDGIMAYLGESKKMCPYSGCQSMLGRKDLVEHFLLKMKLFVKNQEI